MRKLVVFAVLVFLAWFFFIRPGSSEFGCETAAAVAVAHAEDGACPSSVEAAASDPGWAADRLAAIKDEPLTAGVLYDDEGSEYDFTSGEGDDAERVDEILREEGAPFPRDRSGEE